MKRSTRLAVCARAREVVEQVCRAEALAAQDALTARVAEVSRAAADADAGAARREAVLATPGGVAPARLELDGRALDLARLREAALARTLPGLEAQLERRRQEQLAASTARRALDAAVERAREDERAAAARKAAGAADDQSSTRYGRLAQERP